jgi:hypothetical protein
VPQSPGLLVVSTHVPLQSMEADPEQPVAHEYVLPDAAQTGAVLGQTVPQAPQLTVFVMSVSHPSPGSPGQWSHPGAHDDAGKMHLPD